MAHSQDPNGGCVEQSVASACSKAHEHTIRIAVKKDSLLSADRLLWVTSGRLTSWMSHAPLNQNGDKISLLSSAGNAVDSVEYLSVQVSSGKPRNFTAKRQRGRAPALRPAGSPLEPVMNFSVDLQKLGRSLARQRTRWSARLRPSTGAGLQMLPGVQCKVHDRL